MILQTKKHKIIAFTTLFGLFVHQKINTSAIFPLVNPLDLTISIKSITGQYLNHHNASSSYTLCRSRALRHNYCHTARSFFFLKSGSFWIENIEKNRLERIYLGSENSGSSTENVMHSTAKFTCSHVAKSKNALLTPPPDFSLNSTRHHHHPPTPYGDPTNTLRHSTPCPPNPASSAPPACPCQTACSNRSRSPSPRESCCRRTWSG